MAMCEILDPIEETSPSPEEENSRLEQLMISMLEVRGRKERRKGVREGEKGRREEVKKKEREGEREEGRERGRE